ncbi:MAG: dynamin family protein [Bryobacteraceae bacterium]|jgi:GTP-binding protein EngB required for normal cell division
MTEPTAIPIVPDAVREALETVRALCGRYQISALEDFLESCQSFAQEKILNIAVLGRFKAGKSSFLNHLLGKALLPVGVIPVTTVVTEIQYGPEERAQIRFLDGRTDSVELRRISEFISESENPENQKQVAQVRLELPSMERYRGIRFVDTPGLESVLEHNTDASLEWLPNVGLALVAVGVDPPLSRHDIELIRSLSHYTPNISLLLTKVDVLEPDEREQVQDFVQKQLARYWNRSVPVFPYSTRAGFESLRSRLDQDLLSHIQAQPAEQHNIILRHKLDSLLGECAGYLNLALKSAEIADSEREDLRLKILGRKEAIDDTRLGLRLIVRHAMGATRSTFERCLQDEETPVRQRLLTSLEREFPSWTRSLLMATERFDDWLQERVTEEMSALSKKHRGEFVEPLQRVGRQLSQSLQDFRNRLSERTLETLGVPLRTTEMDLNAEDPRSPDVRVGKIFDRNWELLSFLVPMTIFRGLVGRHFERKVGDVIFMNLSRLASQWEKIVNGALLKLEKDAMRRLDSLVATIQKLIASAGQEAPRIRQDLERLQELRDRLSPRGHSTTGTDFDSTIR